MEGGIFKKYEAQIAKNKDEKQALITFIEEQTQILLGEKEIQITGKKVKIQTTSTKRLMITSRNITKVLKEKGYTDS